MFSSTLSTIVFFFNEPVHKTLYIRVAVLSSWIGFPVSVWVNIKKLNIFISYSHHKFLALLTWHFPVIPQLVSCDSTNETSIRYTCFHKKGNCFGQLFLEYSDGILHQLRHLTTWLTERTVPFSLLALWRHFVESFFLQVTNGKFQHLLLTVIVEMPKWPSICWRMRIHPFFSE